MRLWFGLRRADTLGRMDDHTLRVLEFDKVLALLAAETAFSGGRERALTVRPATKFSEAQRLQRLTAEMRLVDQMGIDIPFSGAADIRPAIQSAAIGQLLEPPDLVSAAATLRTAQRGRNVIERIADRVPGLAEVVAFVADFRPYTDAIETSIDARGQVADAASPELAATRRELRVAEARLDSLAQSALADALRRDVAQEAILTERNGRKVIPIKAELRTRVPGIVHDVSSSGATVFIEPMAVVDAGNRVRELQLAEEREVRRILQRLTDLLGSRAEEATTAFDTLSHLDVLVASVRLARRFKADLPPPGDADSWLQPAGTTVLVAARHPLLVGDVVPIDADIGGDAPGLLITGPNTGGKTVALKTIGLLTLMAQAGLPLPCRDSSRLVVYEQVHADIGDEQSIEQSLSTFSSHMRNVIRILEHARPGTLVLLDELGAGTDPMEGAALARAIVEVLLERGCTVVATTHHAELKAFATADPRIRNASVEFDLERLTPTYHLTVGLPGQSNALAIARRLGLEEAVVERATSRLAPEHFEVERMLGEIRSERAAAAEARLGESIARAEAEAIRAELARRRDAIESERQDVLATATRTAEDELAAMRRELADLRRRAADRPTFDSAAAEQTLREMDTQLARLKEQARPRRQPPIPSPIAAIAAEAVEPGMEVHVRDIPQPGVALSEVGDDGKVEVQFGGLRMKVSVERIDRVGGHQLSPELPSAVPETPARAHNVAMELDLRGQRAEEALLNFERYLDEAFRAGYPFVRIIHGKGTGALRAAIREALTSHPLVRSFESAPPREGGDGVTVAILAG